MHIGILEDGIKGGKKVTWHLLALFQTNNFKNRLFPIHPIIPVFHGCLIPIVNEKSQVI